MYGYVIPDTETVKPKDFSMYRAAYCGMCIEIKKEFGNVPRFSTNYDMTFFTLLAIEAAAPKIEFENVLCIGSPGKKTIIKSCEFLKKAAEINILLFYAKLTDDEVDSGKKKALKTLFSSAYEKARASFPEADEIIRTRYEGLREYEKNKGGSLDRAADYFASMMRDLFLLMIKGTNEFNENYVDCFKGLTYNLGKFVYIADAIDDTTEDHRSGSYNPVLISFPDYAGSRREYFEKHDAELRFALNSCIYRITENFNRIHCTQVGGILENIIYHGLKKKADELLKSVKKLRAPNVAIPKKRLRSYRREWREERDRLRTAENGDNE